MRISNAMIYDTNLHHMQTSLANYMESNIQGGTQKKVNKPSDDPAGTALILNSRTNIAATTQYERNVDSARGWLELTDATLGEVSSTLTAIEALALQASNGDLSDENRDQIAVQLEQLFGQLLNLSNTEYSGSSIFGGHNYNENAFEEGLAVHTYDENFDTTGVTVTGKADASMSIRFVEGGGNAVGDTITIGGDPLTDPTIKDVNYQYTTDGGRTWTDGVLTAGQTSIDIDGVQMSMRAGTQVTTATAEPTDGISSKEGTFLVIYPTAIYTGDDNDASAYGAVTGGIPGLDTEIHATVTDNIILELTADANLHAPGSVVEYTVDGTAYTTTVPDPANGTVQLPFTGSDGKQGFIELNTQNSVPVPPATDPILSAGMRVDMQPRRVDMLNGSELVEINAQGIFSQNTLVRIDGTPGANPGDPMQDVDLSVAGATINYSYSNDGGRTWIQSVSQVPDPAGSATLTVPGGFMELTAPAGTVLEPNTQMLIHPDRAELGFEIMENTYVPVNQVGKDIFGGEYNGQTVEGFNIFDTVGKLIAFCENNESDGIGEMYAALKEGVHAHMLTPYAKVGGLENRLDLASSMLSAEKLDQEARLSYTEDIDLTELLNQLAKDELAYSTVLKSASMILQTNLTNYI